MSCDPIILLTQLACATHGLSSTLGQSSKAIGHICELQSQRRREVARELVVLRYNVTNCCVHGLKIRSHKRMQVLITLTHHMLLTLSVLLTCNFNKHCCSEQSRTLTMRPCLISTARRRLKVASSLSALKPRGSQNPIGSCTPNSFAGSKDE